MAAWSHTRLQPAKDMRDEKSEHNDIEANGHRGDCRKCMFCGKGGVFFGKGLHKVRGGRDKSKMAWRANRDIDIRR